jgi:crotonobetainyl-CoA:carnitine CoA-transferase CaiB-like acyl-CoA transferase
MIAGGDGGSLLKGVKIVDLTSVVFGPYSTQILADLGADVIKVETPNGDIFRYSAKAAQTVGMAPGFIALNRGKQSVVLDLKQADDLAVMKDLLKDADVFMLNVRGKGAERLGLDYEAVKALNPEIIYAHCVGFGQDGPYADLQAYDDVIQAATGTTTLLTRVDGNPKARYFPSLIADKVAGLHGAYGVLAAIIHKLRTGRGQKVEVPMFEAFASFILAEHLGGLTFDPPVGPVCYRRQIDPDRQPFPTKDGYISIVVYNDETWFRVFKVLQAMEVLDEERFATRKLRSTNLGPLYQEVARLTQGFTTAELAAACQSANIPAQPVCDMEDVLSEPHLAATGFFKRRSHPSEGEYFEMQPPIRFSDADTAPRGSAPLLNEHGDAVRSADSAPS